MSVLRVSLSLLSLPLFHIHATILLLLRAIRFFLMALLVAVLTSCSRPFIYEYRPCSIPFHVVVCCTYQCFPTGRKFALRFFAISSINRNSCCFHMLLLFVAYLVPTCTISYRANFFVSLACLMSAHNRQWSARQGGCDHGMPRTSLSIK